MKKVHYLLLSYLIYSILIGCKEEKVLDVPKEYISELSITENLSDFTSKMTEKDTIKIIANLTMEYAVRIDELTLTKRNNTLILQTTIKEDTTFELKYQMRKTELPELQINNLNNEFEQHFLTHSRRTKIDTSRGWIYKLINQKDTLRFNTLGLADKATSISEYIPFLQKYYPLDSIFKPYGFIENDIGIIEDESDQVAQPSYCNCKLNNHTRNREADLLFRNSEYSQKENDSIFLKWSNTSLRDQIKSIRFSGFDTIPNKYTVFKNVEKVSIESRSGIYGLDVFPALKTIHFFGSKIHLDTDEKWMNRIEAFYAEKTSFTGLDSFSKMSNLTIIHFAFSGFDTFPKDLDHLKCLHKMTFGVYTYGKVDLNTLDFSHNKCLKEVQFLSWQNAFNGIPKGIINSNIKELKIDHPNLTSTEKKELKKIKASL